MRDTDTANSVEEYETELADFFAGLGQKIDSTVENYETELAGFFADLDQKINGTVTDHEAELANFFAGLGPVVNIAKRAQAELDRTAATKFSVFNYFKQAATNRIRKSIYLGYSAAFSTQ